MAIFRENVSDALTPNPLATSFLRTCANASRSVAATPRVAARAPPFATAELSPSKNTPKVIRRKKTSGWFSRTMFVATSHALALAPRVVNPSGHSAHARDPASPANDPAPHGAHRLSPVAPA